ncbi:MAG: TetR/AcrR family transcriptional regulator [Deltaproteobacteria bacterium]|nr:MAG: TetR/AcrR family transcriptional regulator [Deltaproteobacteria bacterium]
MRAPKINTEIRPEQITEAAIDLIAAEGVNSLLIAAIAERVGIVPSAFYRHYKSKDEVLDAILDQLRTKLLGNVAAVRSESKKAPERLKRLMQRHVSLLAENHIIPQIVFSDNFYAGHAERKSKVKGVVADYLGEVQKIVAEGQKDGTIVAGISPETVSVMILGMVLPTAVLRNGTGGRFDVDRYVENAWPVFKKGISA